MARHAMLIGEPNRASGSFLGRALVEQGYAAAVFHEGQRSLAHARQHAPDLVVIAGPTPDLGPAALCRSLKLQQSTCLLPVVLVREREAAEGALHLEIEPDAELDPLARLPEVVGAFEQALAVQREQQREGVRAEVRFRLPSDMERLEELLDLLEPWLDDCGLSAYPAQRMRRAVREVAANAIEWGHHGQRDRMVSVVCWLDAEKVSVLVSDTGAGFDRRNLPHAARPGDPISHLQARADRNLREGGFGILMASGLVDHLFYNEAGNEAQLLKFLPVRRRTQQPREPVAVRR